MKDEKENGPAPTVATDNSGRKPNLLQWLKDERNLLQNTGSLMWHQPEEQQKTLAIAKHLDTTIRYIELSGKSAELSAVEKGQDQLWREVDKIFNVKWSYGMPDHVMEELKEKFTITRKS